MPKLSITTFPGKDIAGRFPRGAFERKITPLLVTLPPNARIVSMIRRDASAREKYGSLTCKVAGHNDIVGVNSPSSGIGYHLQRKLSDRTSTFDRKASSTISN